MQVESALRTVARAFAGDEPGAGHIHVISCVQLVKVSGAQKIADKIRFQMAVTGIIFFA